MMSISSLSAKEKKSSDTLKKVVALGHLGTMQLRLSSIQTGDLGDILRDKIKRELEGTGKYAVVIPKETSEEEEDKAPEPKKTPQTAADMMKYAAEMQKYTEKMMAKYQDRYLHVSVAAQALFSFELHQDETHMGTGTAFDTAEDLTGARVHAFDFSTDKTKLTLTCVQRDPEKGNVMDSFDARASSTSIRQFKDMFVYTSGNESDRTRVFDKMFKDSVKKCVSWIDKKMSKEAWKGEIIKVKGKDYYINAGANAGIKEGMAFRVVEQVPVSGKGVELGVEENEKGMMEIVGVQDRYAIGRIMSGSVKVGDIILKTAVKN